MLGFMDGLGNATRRTYRSIGVFGEEIIYTLIYNMGGHGTNEAVLYYSEYMAVNYNIVFHHQVSQSTETNMIDLGARMTVQSKVKKYHHRKVKQHDALYWYVKKLWHNVEEN